VETKDGRAFSVTYGDLWRDEGKWMLQFRCKICADAIGELADIAVSDVWANGEPKGEDAGFNGFIARTPKGRVLLDDAVRDGALVLVEELDFRDLDAVQPHQVRKKQAITARLAAMRDTGAAFPSFSRLRLAEAAATASADAREADYSGMRARLERGDNLEPPAVAGRSGSLSNVDR
jgi:coenzyme F420 hydrogenase subunit beta